jgi:hypothetical protein
VPDAQVSADREFDSVVDNLNNEGSQYNKKCAKYHGEYISQTEERDFISITFTNVVTAVYANKPRGFSDNDCVKSPQIYAGQKGGIIIVDRKTNTYKFRHHLSSDGRRVRPYYIFYRDTSSSGIDLESAYQVVALDKALSTVDPYMAKMNSDLFKDSGKYLRRIEVGEQFPTFYVNPDPKIKGFAKFTRPSTPSTTRSTSGDKQSTSRRKEGSSDKEKECVGKTCIIAGGRSRKKNKRKTKKTANRRLTRKR